MMRHGGIARSFRRRTPRAWPTQRFEGVDYFAKVWLNGTLLGEHEGYADPFSFEKWGRFYARIGQMCLWSKCRRLGTTSMLIPKNLFTRLSAILLKGSYEHADTFVQKDVNSIGIWRPVRTSVSR